MKVLVVGGTGFVGSALTAQLAESGAHVVSVCRNDPGSFVGTVILADRSDISQLTSDLGDEKFDFVVDTCAMDAQHAALFAALQHTSKVWVHISSGSVYSDVTKTPFHEHNEAHGADHWGKYGKDKAELEYHLRQANQGKCRLLMVRAPYLYGPGNSSDREQFFFRHAVNQQPILVPANETLANFVFIDDFSKSLIALGRSGADQAVDVINVSSAQAISLRHFVLECVAACGADPALVQVVDNARYDVAPRKFFPFRTNDLVLSNDRFHANFAPDVIETDLRSGLITTLRTMRPEALVMNDQTSREKFLGAKKAVGSTVQTEPK